MFSCITTSNLNFCDIIKENYTKTLIFHFDFNPLISWTGLLRVDLQITPGIPREHIPVSC